MNNIIAIDPGVHTGIAFFENSILQKALTLGMPAAKKDGLELKNAITYLCVEIARSGVKHAYIENPSIYDRKRWKGNPNDLIKVANVAGMCFAACSLYCQAHFVKPTEWKGQTEKAIDNKRTLQLLSDAEHSIAKGQSDHVLDAIGIGLWALKRK